MRPLVLRARLATGLPFRYVAGSTTLGGAACDGVFDKVGALALRIYPGCETHSDGSLSGAAPEELRQHGVDPSEDLLGGREEVR